MLTALLPSTVIVVGASGFIGRNLVDALASKVECLIGVTGSGKAVPGCDLTVQGSRLHELPALPGDTVLLHLGAYRYDAARFDLAQSDILENNVALGGRLYHFCAERGIREVRLASSVAVYPADLAIMDDSVPVDLNAPPHAGEAFYAWSKRYVEVLASLYKERFGINSVVFRLSNPFGPYDSLNPAKAHVAPAFVMKALSSDPVFEIRGDPLVERDFIYVGDVVEILVRSLHRRGENAVFNLATGRVTTLLRFAETVMRVAGVDKEIQAGAPGAFGPAARRSMGCRVQEAFGLEFRGVEDGLRPTIAWYRNAYRP